MNDKKILTLILLLIFIMVVPVRAADIVLLFDASPSMDDYPVDGSQVNKIELARQGVDSFLSSLSESDRVALIVFYGCNNIRTEVDFTQDKDQIRRALSSVNTLSSSGTAIAQALQTGWSYLKQNGRKCEECSCEKWAIVLFTDGEETCHEDGCSVASNIAREMKQYSPTPVYVIAYDMPTNTDPYESRNDLPCIAQSTGGTLKSCPTSVDLNMAFKQAAIDISTDITRSGNRCTSFSNLASIGIVSIVLIAGALIALKIGWR
jgi:hypothetical protein